MTKFNEMLVSRENFTRMSQETVTRKVTKYCLYGLKKDNRLSSMSLSEVNDCVVAERAEVYRRRNSMVEKDMQWSIPQHSTPMQIAEIISWCCKVICVSWAEGDKSNLLAAYQGAGFNKGIYSTSEEAVDGLIEQVSGELSCSCIKQVKKYLMRRVPHAFVNNDRDLIAVGNGIFNYKTKELMPFSPDRVFLSKSPVNYRENAVNPVIKNPDGTDFELESYISGLSDAPGVPELLWQVIGAAVRPDVSWNRFAMLLGEQGCNGKGTLCELIRNLCGRKRCANIPLAEFSKDFALGELIGASAVVTDENDVGRPIRRSGNLKAAVTGDVIQINRKFKEPVSYRFKGFMVQCANAMPKYGDSTESLYRRQLVIPFDKSFTGSSERRYIKDDYMKRPAVLEYALWRVLNMEDYYELSEPEACRKVQGKCRVYNNPALQFWTEMRERFQWDLLPFQFLYDLYAAWKKRSGFTGGPANRNALARELRKIVADDEVWEATDPKSNKGTSDRMSKPEPMLEEYGLKKWETYRTGNFRGLYRTSACEPAEK